MSRFIFETLYFKLKSFIHLNSFLVFFFTSKIITSLPSTVKFAFMKFHQNMNKRNVISCRTSTGSFQDLPCIDTNRICFISRMICYHSRFMIRPIHGRIDLLTLSVPRAQFFWVNMYCPVGSLSDIFLIFFEVQSKFPTIKRAIMYDSKNLILSQIFRTSIYQK